MIYGSAYLTCCANILFVKFQFVVVLDRYFGDICEFYGLVQGSCQKNISEYSNGRRGNANAGTLALLSTPSGC